MPPHFINPPIFEIEIIFTVIAVIFCFLIYFRTKESYELTKYKGLMYFRDAFLFFGLSYLTRFITSLMFFYRSFNFAFSRELFAPLTMIPLSYFSTIGIFYLIFGTVWKKFNNRWMLLFGHSLAVLLAIIAFITRSPVLLLYMQCAMLALAVIIVIAAKAEKKISKSKLLYITTAVLWLINLLIIDPGHPLHPALRDIFQVASLAVFAVIYFRLSKWLK
jgi:hypothetical protein